MASGSDRIQSWLSQEGWKAIRESAQSLSIIEDIFSSIDSSPQTDLGDLGEEKMQLLQSSIADWITTLAVMEVVDQQILALNAATIIQAYGSYDCQFVLRAAIYRSCIETGGYVEDVAQSYYLVNETVQAHALAPHDDETDFAFSLRIIYALERDMRECLAIHTSA